MHDTATCTLGTSHAVPPRSKLWSASLAVLAVALAGAHATPQTPAPPQVPAFDVAAIHPHNPAPHEGSHVVDSNGRFSTENVSLKAIIQWAFDVPQSRIIGGPSWIGSSRWDIEAKAENALDMQKTFDAIAATEEKRHMVQSLLGDRFGLLVHSEMRELPLYALVTTREGAKFTSTHASGTLVNRSNGRIEIEGGKNTVDILAEQLAEVLERVVVNNTGIEGSYKVALTWTPEEAAGPPAHASTADSGPSIFTALQEQLGLKLETQKGAVPVLVIDRVELPTTN